MPFDPGHNINIPQLPMKKGGSCRRLPQVADKDLRSHFLRLPLLYNHEMTCHIK